MIVREFEARFTAGRRFRKVTFTVAEEDRKPFPPREYIASVARAELAMQTTIPIPDWTMVRLIEVTNGMTSDVT